MIEPVRDIIWVKGVKHTAAEIMLQVASRYDMTVEEMLQATRQKRFAQARQEAMWEIRQRTGHSLPWIASKMRLKDHTTILWGIRRHAERLAERAGGDA